jgi:hypothetical protein
MRALTLLVASRFTVADAICEEYELFRPMCRA